jgi:hypothetical protein
MKKVLEGSHRSAKLQSTTGVAEFSLPSSTSDDSSVHRAEHG